MKKTLVALAALAAVGAASAQSTVTLYGRLDAAVGYLEVESTGTGFSFGTANPTGVTTAAMTSFAQDVGGAVQSNQLSGSRWGMRGSEDLGGGMKANFTLEGGILLDAGTSAQGFRLFGRQAFLGLSSGWGALTLGRQYTIMSGGVWALTGGYANYDAWSSSNDNAGFGNPGSVTADAVRKNNSLLYVTPSMSGFSGQFMWAPGENGQTAPAASRSASNYYSVGLGYVNGPMNIQFGYEWDKIFVGATAVSADTKQTGIAGSWNFGMVTVSAAWQAGELKNGGLKVEDEGYALGANGNLGPVNLAVEWAQEKSDLNGASLSEASAINVRVTYPLSKRTDLYGIWADGSSNFEDKTLGDQSLSKIMIGIRHSF